MGTVYADYFYLSNDFFDFVDSLLHTQGNLEKVLTDKASSHY